MPYEALSSVRHEVVDMDEVTRLYEMPEFTSPDSISERVKMICRSDTKIRTVIYTDGEVIKVSEPKPVSIDEYYINGKKYDGEVSELIKRRAYIRDASYVVKITLTSEVIDIRGINKKGRGVFYVIKDAKVFLKDSKNKAAIKKAKDTLKSIKRHLSIKKTKLNQIN